MSHRILDNLSWIENIVHESGSEYTLELGDPTVFRVSAEESFVVTLAGGSEISISATIQLLNKNKKLLIDPWSSAGMELIRQVSSSRIWEATVTSDGTLNLAFNGVSAGELLLIARPNTWKVYFSNGSGVVGLEGGGIELLPPNPNK